MNDSGAENLPPGWVRDEQGRLRRETVHSMLRRLPGWDYRGRAIYQITITLADRSAGLLGRLEVKGPGGWVSVETARAAREPYRPEEIEARVVASELGREVERCWGEIGRYYPQVRPIGFQLMPEHLHGLLFVTEPMACHLGQVIKGFKIGCNKAARALGVISSPTLSARTGQAGLFAEGFQDTILLRAGQLDNMFHYLADNPRRRAIKALFPGLFRVVAELALPLATGGADAPREIGRFSALGNRFLLQRPLAQVQVSRSDLVYRREPKPGGGLKIARDATGAPIVAFASPRFAEKKALLFAAAKHGSVLISPCVSDGEREIARLALHADLPLVTLHNKGFSKLQKPSGRYFDACADGRLLMLAPAAWPYQPGEKKMTRFDATAMNRLCQWLVGEEAAEINYHGMKPANIDALARAAAKAESV